MPPADGASGTEGRKVGQGSRGRISHTFGVFINLFFQLSLGLLCFSFLPNFQKC